MKVIMIFNRNVLGFFSVRYTFIPLPGSFASASFSVLYISVYVARISVITIPNALWDRVFDRCH